MVAVGSSQDVLVRRRQAGGRPASRSSAARTARRTSSTGPPSRSTGSTSRAARRSSVAKPAEVDRGGSRSDDPAVHRRRRPGPADPRRQERPVALAAGRHDGPGHAGPGRSSATRPAGAPTSGASARSCATRTRASTTCTSIDPSATQILRYSPAVDGTASRPRADGLAGRPQDVSSVDAMLIDGDIYVTQGGTLEPLHQRRLEGLEARRSGRRGPPRRLPATPC